MTQELQWRFSHFAQKAHERNDDKCGSGHHGALEENTPVPEHLERRQAVGAVVKLAHGLGKECLLLKLLLLTFVAPVMTRELAHNDVGNRVNSVNL